MNVPKPLFKVGIGCLVVLLTCVGGVGFMAWRILGGEVKPTTDYAAEINALVESYQKDAAGEKNAWGELVAIAERSRSIHMAIGAARTGEKLNVPPDPSVLRSQRSIGDGQYQLKMEDVEAAWKVMKELEAKGVFSDLDALANRRRAVRTADAGSGMLLLMPFPELGSARQLARANAARYHLALLKEDGDTALRALETGIAQGRLFMQQGRMLDRLLGQAIISLHLNVMLETVETIRDEDFLKRVLAVIERQTQVPPLTLVLESERRGLLDTIQWSFTDLGDGNGYLSAKGLAAVQAPVAAGGVSPGDLILGVMSADRQETTRMMNGYFDQMVKSAAMPRQERMKLGVEMDSEQLPRRHIFLKMVLPAFTYLPNADDRLKLDIAAARTVLSVELWKQRSGGRPPENLTELVPGVIRELPLDPFSGKPLGYKLDGQRDTYGPIGKYVLYSFGADGVDNGGAEVVVGPTSAYAPMNVLTKNPPLTGFDYVVYPIESYDR